ncbi:MAG: hypothetical protein ABSC56_00355 [Solirubrobacteraceae bacterium]|jgi:cytochrome c-type biogenesis protein CcmH/NrfF
MIADFGTNYTGIGWLTVVVPLGFLVIVVGLWVRAFRRADRGDSSEPPRTER